MHRFAPRILLPLYTAAVIHCVCSALAGLYRLPSEIDYLLENVDLMYFLRELRMRNRTLKSLGKKGLEWLVSPYFGLVCMILWYNYKLHSGTLLLSSADPFLFLKVSVQWGNVTGLGLCSPLLHGWSNVAANPCDVKRETTAAESHQAVGTELRSSSLSFLQDTPASMNLATSSLILLNPQTTTFLYFYDSMILLSSWLLEQTTPSSDQPCRYGSPKIPWLRTCTFARSLPLARSFFDTAELCPSRSLAIIN